MGRKKFFLKNTVTIPSSGLLSTLIIFLTLDYTSNFQLKIAHIFSKSYLSYSSLLDNHLVELYLGTSTLKNMEMLDFH